MDKLVLIDGNSLLNRAFYAMRVFSTSDGLPTNGIFGFVKLLFKIIDEEKPAYLVVTFDLPVPTFRHRLYGDYKGTRKPMPDELAQQVPVLKDLLKSMNICILEKEGYEADDLLGTLSKKFGGVDVDIYTGDRDSYQLVGEHVSVCFTKRGVTDLDRLTGENFREKTGLEPWQIIEEKSLVGDSSDNIPGVKGIGPKSAMELLTTYGSLDEIYRNLDKLSPTLRKKLEAEEETARLSHTLATIDRDVPLDLTLEETRLTLPFPEKAREFFKKLEFRSLLGNAYFPSEHKTAAQSVVCSDLNEILPLLSEVKIFSFYWDARECHIYFGGREYILPLKDSLLGTGFFADDLKPLLIQLFSAERTAVVSDIKSLAHRLDELGISFQNAEDVSLLRYMADSNQRPVSEKELAEQYVLPQENLAYALWLAYEETKEKIAGTDAEKIYRTIELPLVWVLLDMERTGVRVDTGKFGEFFDKFGAEIAELSKEIFRLAGGTPFNLNSPLQLSQVLFGKLGFETKGIKKNSRDGYSTGADVLEKLAEKYELPKLILRYRELQKLQSTYIDGIRPLVLGGIVHTTYHQTATTTGRLSSTNPNLQNIPVRTDEGRELRKLFIAREGNILVDADYSQIELRLLAHCSDCKALIKAYRDGEDVHAATAARVFGVALSEVTPQMRRRAKTINFGIIYGMSGFGLAKDLNCSTMEAQSYIDKYFAMHPEVKEYMDENVRRAKEDGYVTTILGRKRLIPEVRSSNHNVRSFGERAAMNMPLQGSAADIIKLAMLRVAERLKRENLRSKLVLQVHDELVLDTPEEERDRAERVLREEMENAVVLNVPLVAQVSTGKSWYDAK